MARRIFLPHLSLGGNPLPPAARHHLVDVLRLPDGAAVEPFDSSGNTGVATLRLEPEPHLEVQEIRPPVARRELTVASAVPKGDRADYLVEKLSELGVFHWIPLQTARSVVHPTGPSKHDRWTRIAQEAARQSHAPGVLTIAPLTLLSKLQLPSITWFCSTAPGAVPAREALRPDLVLIGPEGGWTPEEEASLSAAGHIAVTLGTTILRTETAAVVAAAICLTAT